MRSQLGAAVGRRNKNQDAKCLLLKGNVKQLNTMTIRLSTQLLLLLPLTLSLIPLPTASARCVMNGTCAYTDNIGGSMAVPCSSDHEPSSIDYSWLDSEIKESFKLLCPMLDIEGPLCCNHEQIESMVDNIMNVPKQLLGRCPSCFANFAALFCSMTCDPNQSNFVKVTRAVDSDPGLAPTNSKAVDTIEVSIASEWPEKLYNSCKDIDMSGLGRAIVVMGCDGKDCNGHKLVEALGSRDKSPFLVNYKYFTASTNVKSSRDYMNVTTYRCDSSPVGSFDEFSCSCADCRDSCPLVPENEVVDECTSNSLDDLINDPVQEALKPLLGSRIARITAMMVIAMIVSSVVFIALIRTGGRSHADVRTGQVIRKRSPPKEDLSSDQKYYTPILSNNKISSTDNKTSSSGDQKSSSKCNLLDKWTRFCCRYPFVMMITGFIIVAGTSSNLVWLKVVNDPVSLWSSPHSRSRIEKSFFDEHFGPFFRIQQVIVSNVDKDVFEYTFSDGKTVNVTSLLKPVLMEKLLELENDISKIIVTSDDSNVNGTTFDTICHQPLSNGKCVIQSPLNYFQSNKELLYRSPQKYIDHVRTCLKNPVSPLDDQYFNVPCLAAFGGPAFPNVVFGGYPDDDVSNCGGKKKNVSNTDEPIKVLSQSYSMVITFLVRNHRVGTVEHKKAVEWESRFLSFMDQFISDQRDPTYGVDTNIISLANQSLSVTYFSERSMEDEITRQSDADVPIVAVSYFIMFTYICVSLGQFTEKKRILVDSKIGIGLAGIFISFAGVSAAVGITAVIGIDATPIAGVLPFMLLFTGVNNVFVLVQSSQRLDWKPNETVEDRVARAMSSVGPSILLSVSAQAACFLIGSLLSSMPATFALNAGLALISFLVYFFTLFISVLYLDMIRQLDGRLDILACLQIDHGNVDVPLSPTFLSDSQVTMVQKKSIKVLSSLSTKVSRFQNWFSKYFIPCIMTRNRGPRIFLVIVGIFSACLTISLLPELNIGLEQEVSVPDDSSIAKYFKDQKQVLKVGAPVFFVLKSAEPSIQGLDLYGTHDHKQHVIAGEVFLDFNTTSGQNIVCGDGSCFNSSLSNSLRKRSRDPRSRITGPVNSWLDDYLAWVSSASCCRTFVNDSSKFCPSTLVQDGLDRSKNCTPCDGVTGKRPADFYKYLNWFLSDDPTRDCSVGGHAQYSTAISFLDTSISKRTGTNSSERIRDGQVIEASWFMAYHKPASVSEDFAASLVEGRELASDIEKTFKSEFNVSAKVFPYSMYYVFYEQYLNIWMDALMALSTSLFTILAVVLISSLSGHLINALIFLVTLISFLIHLMGFMYWWNISLNALSLVNLVMACGLSVEFCCHVLVAFYKYQPTDEDHHVVSNGNGQNKVKNGNSNHVEPCRGVKGQKNYDVRTKASIHALKVSGSSILSGITATIMIGLIFMGFAKSKIFHIYYLRMYFAIGLFGSFHGLIVLPVLLSLFGRVKGHWSNNCSCHDQDTTSLIEDCATTPNITDESSMTVTVETSNNGFSPQSLGITEPSANNGNNGNVGVSESSVEMVSSNSSGTSAKVSSSNSEYQSNKNKMQTDGQLVDETNAGIGISS